MNWKHLSAVVLSGLLVTLAGCPKKQTLAAPEADITVAADGSEDYETIEQALLAASDGDVIYVKAGTYQEAVEIEDLDDLVLVGAGPGKTIIDADDGYAALTLDADGLEISGFALTGASSHGIYVKDGEHRIHHCLVHHNGDRGIYYSSFSGNPTCRIDHCTVVHNDVSGIYIPTDEEGNRVTNCIIALNGRGIVSDENTGNMAVNYNCLSNDGEDLDRVPEGEDNIFEDPGFIDSDDKDYQLAPDSPCRGAASDGNNIGCF